MTVEEFLDKLAPVNWFRERDLGDADARRYQFAMDKMQQHFPGKYVLEEAFDPNSLLFKYRLKFLTEADELWFKLKYQ